MILVTLVFLTGLVLGMFSSYLEKSYTPTPPSIPSVPAKVALYPTTNVNIRTSPCVRKDNILLYQDKTRVVVKIDDPSQKIETNGQVHYCTESDTKEQTPWILVTVENQTIKGSANAWVNACKFKADKKYFPCMSVMETMPPVALVTPPPPPVEVAVKPVQTEPQPKPEQAEVKNQTKSSFDCGSWSNFVMKKDALYRSVKLTKGDTVQLVAMKHTDHSIITIIRNGKEIDMPFSINCKGLHDLYQ